MDAFFEAERPTCLPNYVLFRSEDLLKSDFMPDVEGAIEISGMPNFDRTSRRLGIASGLRLGSSIGSGPGDQLLRRFLWKIRLLCAYREEDFQGVVHGYPHT